MSAESLKSWCPMKTTMFKMSHMRTIVGAKGADRVHVPTLSAYAIEFAEFTPPPNLDVGHIEFVEGRDFRLEGDHVILAAPLNQYFGSIGGEHSGVKLVIHYHGIRDYELLFPQVTELSLRSRLGQFYEEAEKVFDIGAWLSFALAASAIYEGLLGWRLGRTRGVLADLVEEAFKNRIIASGDRQILDVARKARNLVHASRHKEQCITRTEAMDMRTVMDKLVRTLSIQASEIQQNDLGEDQKVTVLIASRSAGDWKQFLANPEKHWRTGYSARTLAYSWQEALGFPREVRAVLAQQFPEIEMLFGIPEHKVALPGGGRASQTDLWALARAGDDLVSIAVEGKVSETFGPTVDEWLIDTSDGKRERLSFLCAQLGCGEDVPGTVRYQLLHRAASAILEAKRFRAQHAVLLVHSFSRTREWLDDFIAFGALFGVDAGADRLTLVGECNGVQFSMGWVRGDEVYLTR